VIIHGIDTPCLRFRIVTGQHMDKPVEYEPELVSAITRTSLGKSYAVDSGITNGVDRPHMNRTTRV